MMLRGMGFANDTSIYLASGKIYGAERHLVPLLKMFPHLHTKESLSTQDELAPFVVNSCPRSCTMFKIVFCSSGPGDMEINFNLSKHYYLQKSHMIASVHQKPKYINQCVTS